MLKFFRKYNKMLLAVFGVLLMIVFVGGSALESLWTPKANALMAESKLGPIELSHQQYAQATTTLLDRMGFNWRQPFGGGGEPLTIIDWILLTREAHQYQTEPSPEAVRAWLEGQTTPEGRNLLDGVDMFARRLGVKTTRILQAIAEFRAVQVTVQAMSGAAAASTPAIRTAARDALEQVKVNAVVLPATAFADDKGQFSENEVEAQWQKYRDAKPQGGLNFGYYVEPTLTVQYVKIDRDAIAERIGVPNIEKRAKRYFEENRERDPAFRRPPEDRKPGDAGDDAEATPDAVADEAGTDAGEEEEQKSPYLGWEEAMEIAMDTVRRQHADDAADRIANWMCSYESERWLEVQRGKDGYKPAPEGAATLDSYGRMIEVMPPSIGYPEAVSVKVTPPFDKADARTVAEIGPAMYRPARGAAQAFGMLAFRSQPIVPTVPAESGADYADYLAVYQTCPFPLSDGDGNLYVFRVVDSVLGHASESVDEVRDRVVADLRLLGGYELAESWADTLIHWEGAESLEAAYNADTELSSLFASDKGLGGGYYTSPFVSRPGRGSEAGGFGDNVFAGGGLGIVPGDIATEWFALEYTAERMKTFKLPERAAVFVVEWSETQPARIEEYENSKKQIAQNIARYRAEDAIDAWLNPENIRARNAFELAD